MGRRVSWDANSFLLCPRNGQFPRPAAGSPGVEKRLDADGCWYSLEGFIAEYGYVTEERGHRLSKFRVHLQPVSMLHIKVFVEVRVFL